MSGCLVFAEWGGIEDEVDGRGKSIASDSSEGVYVNLCEANVVSSVSCCRLNWMEREVSMDIHLGSYTIRVSTYSYLVL